MIIDVTIVTFAMSSGSRHFTTSLHYFVLRHYRRLPTLGTPFNIVGKHTPIAPF